MNLNQLITCWWYIASGFMLIHGIFMSNSVEVLCGLTSLMSVIVCDALEYRDRVFYRDAYNETLRDANRDLKSMLANMQSIAHDAQSMTQPDHSTRVCPAVLCECVHCTIKKYDRDHVPYEVVWHDNKPVRVYRTDEKWPET